MACFILSFAALYSHTCALLSFSFSFLIQFSSSKFSLDSDLFVAKGYTLFVFLCFASIFITVLLDFQIPLDGPPVYFFRVF